MKINNRLVKIGDYRFAKIKENKKDLLDLGIGDPDLKIHPSIIDGLMKGLNEENFNRYPKGSGTNMLKNAIIKSYKELYNVTLNMDEVLILIGSKEGINKIFACCCDYRDTAIIPQFGYPVYSSSCKLWGIEEYRIPLLEQDEYLPRLENIPDNICRESKIFMINYPNNPTGAIAKDSFYNDVTKYCLKHDILLCNDGAYNEILEENTNPISLLQFDKKKNFVEFGTFSKIYNMTGFRIGYAVGNSYVLKQIEKVKDNCDSGQFTPIQFAATEALNLSSHYKKSVNRIYDERRKVAKKILRAKNIHYFDSKGTFYLWCKVPKGYTTEEFCIELVEKYGIITTPGYFFGNTGNDYFRISLTQKVEKLGAYLNKLKVYNIN